MISSTSKIKSKFKAGDIVNVRVVEFLGDGAWIVSLEGSLVQIRNKARVEFAEGQMIQVKVQSLDPAVLTII